MEVETAKTLVEIGAPLSSEPANSQSLIPTPALDRAGSSPEFLGPVAEAKAAAACAGDEEGLNSDYLGGCVGVENEAGVDEREVLVEKTADRQNGSSVNGNGSCPGDASVTGSLSSSETEGHDDKVAHSDGVQGLKGLVDGESSVLIENDSDNMLDGDSTVLIENDSDNKLESKQNRILLVEVHGSEHSVKASGENCGLKEEQGSLAENMGHLTESFLEIRDTITHKMGENGSTDLIENDSDKKLEVEQNRVSLVLEFSGLGGNVKASGKNCGVKEGEASFAEGRGDQGENVMQIPELRSKMGENGGITGKGVRRDEVNDYGKEENKVETEGEDMGNEEREYCVGDFVWGKIKSHPWWPGQIYDVSDASDYARKYNQKDRLLVAYFGDGSFSWCLPSQLRPFAENFDRMSKQSNSKNFVNAVQKALDEVGRLVELKVTCSCIPEENRIGLARPLALNGGIKKGILVPVCNLSRLSIPYDRPAELIATLRHFAGGVSGSRMLELTVLRSWLSAFYRAKEGCNLPVYHEPQRIYGLEDDSGNMVMDRTDFSGPMEAPVGVASEEDWHSSPGQARFGQNNKSLLKKCPAVLEDKLYHRRKKKSMAELMKVNKPNSEGSTVKEKKGSAVKDVDSLGKQASTSGKKKRKSSEEASTQDGSQFTYPSEKKRDRRKKAEILASPISMEEDCLSAKNGGAEGKGEADEDKISNIEKNGEGDGGKETEKNGDGDAEKETEVVHSPRERKKSKYLSPPFTSLNWWIGRLGYKRDWEAEAEKITKLSQVVDVGCTPIPQRSGQTLQPMLAEEHNSAVGTPANRSKPNEDQKKIIDPMEIQASSTKEVVSEVRSAAINPIYLRKKNSIDIIRSFISAFRNAIYVNGSYYELYHKHRPGRKRKSLSSEPELHVEDAHQTSHKLPDPISPRKKRSERKELVKTGTSRKLKQSGGASGGKKSDKDIAREATTPVSLVVTFPPGFSLPSKNDLIKIFREFGSVNEKETDVLYNSSCARVVFMERSDAEEALKKSLRKSPFGSANVNFRLRYPKGSCKNKRGGISEANPASLRASAIDEASRLTFIKQKLETMTLMLEKSDGSMLPEVKSNLEGEMKGLLKEVSAMATSTSSLKD
ncbi:Non-specific serine/threonine protein kinase [Bertholletia excelsa]